MGMNWNARITIVRSFKSNQIIIKKQGAETIHNLTLKFTWKWDVIYTSPSLYYISRSCHSNLCDAWLVFSSWIESTHDFSITARVWATEWDAVGPAETTLPVALLLTRSMVCLGGDPVLPAGLLPPGVSCFTCVFLLFLPVEGAVWSRRIRFTLYK